MFSPDIAPCRLRSIERCQQVICQVTLRSLEGLRHRGPDRLIQHEVRLRRVVSPRMVARSLDAFRSRMRRNIPMDVDHRHLPDVPARIGGEQTFERLLRTLARAHQIKAEGSVCGVHKRLRCDRSDARLGPGDKRSHREPVGLHRHAHLSGD